MSIGAPTIIIIILAFVVMYVMGKKIEDVQEGEACWRDKFGTADKLREKAERNAANAKTQALTTASLLHQQLAQKDAEIRSLNAALQMANEANYALDVTTLALQQQIRTLDAYWRNSQFGGMVGKNRDGKPSAIPFSRN